MRVRLELVLPSEARSVALVRGVLRQALCSMGAELDVVDDIELVVSEACTNVLNHAADHDEYEVVAAIYDDRCVLEIVDSGGGFPSLSTDGESFGAHNGAGTPAVPAAPVGSPEAECGRGIHLMRALVDRLDFRPVSHDGKTGTAVRMEKTLRWAAAAAPIDG